MLQTIFWEKLFLSLHVFCSKKFDTFQSSVRIPGATVSSRMMGKFISFFNMKMSVTILMIDSRIIGLTD